MEALRKGLPDMEPFSCVAVWGRSVGAAAALQYCSTDPSVAALVSDSAYLDLASLVVPEMLQGPLSGLCHLAAAAGRLARAPGASEAVSRPVDLGRSCFVPALFLHGSDDEIVPSDQAKQLRQAYAGEAQVLLMSCGHDSARPSSAIARAALFLARAFNLESSEVSRLDAYLAKLAAPSAGYKIDKQAEVLLAAEELEKRRWGLLMKAVNACPSYHGATFHRVLAKGQQSPHSTRFVALVSLPSSDCEVCLAWAAETTIHASGQTRIAGTVHFLVVSCSCLSLTRAIVRSDEHHRVAVQDLAVQDLC